MFFCKLNSFCFCISLECGTLIIGVLVFFCSLIEFIRELVLENPSVVLLVASVIYSYLGIFLILGVNMVGLCFHDNWNAFTNYLYLQRRPEYLVPWLLVQFIALMVILVGIVCAFIRFVQFSPLKHSENIYDRPDLLYICLTAVFGNHNHIYFFNNKICYYYLRNANCVWKTNYAEIRSQFIFQDSNLLLKTTK